MSTGKTKDQAATRAASPEGASQSGSRKPWKKKTPVQILLDQVDKLREEISKDEASLKQKREQLQKFEEARKLFEGK
jgi:hypothetical protein